MNQYRLNQKEIDAVLLTDAKTRLQYMVKRVADWEEIWTLKTPDGFVLLGDKNESESIPVWPFSEFAHLCCSGDWANAVPFSISLEQFLTKWIPGIAADQRQIAIFPTSADKALVIDSEELKTLLDLAIAELE
jgi:hypothetical protein